MKAKIIILGLCIFFIAMLQSTVLDYARVYNVKPNLLLIFIVSIALLKGNVEGAIVGFFCGLTQDMIAGKVIGFYALLGLYLGLIVGSVNKRLYRENVLVITFFTFVSTVIYEFCVYFFGTVFRNPVDFISPFKNVIIPEAIYNSVISVFIYIFAIKIYDKLSEMDRLPRKY
ncbi:MAG: rod shape-determining protein MreD [Clostridia bacterium]|nr:rod shape-determining protein MreD [Clostridia bacterium]